MSAPWFVWNDSFAVGIQTFDGHHKGLFQLVNGLYDSVEAGLQDEELRRFLAELIRYTMTHFEAEEAAMEGFSYPGILEHRKEHKQLTEQVLAFVRQCHLKKATISVSLLEFLQDWLTKHILESDLRMSQFLRAHGMA